MSQQAGIPFTLEPHHTLAHESLSTLYGETFPYFSRGRATDNLSVWGLWAGQASLERFLMSQQQTP